MHTLQLIYTEIFLLHVELDANNNNILKIIFRIKKQVF